MKDFKLLVIIVLAPVVLFAGFKKHDLVAKTYALNVTATPGTIVKNQNQATYNSGTIVHITAIPKKSGYTFTSWNGDVMGPTNPLPVTMNANKDIITFFKVKIVNVKNTGAIGNGNTDDTRAIQTAIDEVAGTGGTVLIPAGTYLINAITSLNLKSNMTLKMKKGAILKAIPNSNIRYNIIKLSSVTDVHVIGGIYEGERASHLGTKGEWGMGIGIYSSNNVLVENVIVKNCWGDGFYIQGNNGKNITLESVVVDNNRRNGISIISGNTILVKNSILKNTNGTGPSAGIDVEPNKDDTVKNCQIINNEIMGNQHYGILTYKGAPNTIIFNLTISGNNVHDNGVKNTNVDGIAILSTSGVIISNNNVHNNARNGIRLGNNKTTTNSIGNKITNNKVINNGNSTDNNNFGILLETGSTGNTITGNKITDNKNKNIVDNASGNIIRDNIIH